MGKKFEPTPELLQEILTKYAKNGNYSQTARSVGLSVPVVTRIIKENYQSTTVPKQEQIRLSYHGLTPQEPQYKEKKNFNTILENFYNEVMKNGGIL